MHTTKTKLHITKLHTNVHTQKQYLRTHTEQIHTYQKENLTQNKTARAHTKQITHRHIHTKRNLHTTPNCAQIHTH